MSRALAVTSNKALLAAVADGKRVLVKFTAKWCQPCKAMRPIVRDALKGLKDVRLIEADVDRIGLKEAKRDWQIMSVPTFAYFEDGKEKDRIAGACTKTKIRGLIGPPTPTAK